MSDSHDKNVNLFSLAVASKLAGIPSGTLRIWEKRYNLTNPLKNTKNSRMYNEQDIQRLSKMKNLVDLGQQPSILSKMSIEELHNLENSLVTRGIVVENNFDDFLAEKTANVVFIGDKTYRKYKHQAELSSKIKIEHNVDTIDDLQHFDISGIDALVFEITSVQNEDVKNIHEKLTRYELNKKTLGSILLYEFITNKTLTQLERSGIICLKSGSTLYDIKRACDILRAKKNRNVSSPIPKLYSKNQLAKINDLPNTVDCECPSHLSSLITSLNGFEKYSSECVNISPKDAALHNDLQVLCSQARAILEHGLNKVLEAENLEV